jgi:small-conductance mechanosensitive channel
MLFTLIPSIQMIPAHIIPTQVQTPDPVSELADVIQADNLGLFDYVIAAAIFLGSLVVARLVRWGIERGFARTRTDDFLGNLFGRIGAYIVATFGLIYALEWLGVAIGPLLGALGIAGIALAFALQDILENFVAGIILQIRRPFTTGDEIESLGHEGTVTRVDARSVTIRTPDGETVRLPSASVIKDPIINHTTHGRRRTTVDVGVAYGTDLASATSVASAAAAGVDGVLEHPAPEALVHTFGESSIDMAVRFWHEPSIAELWRTRDEVAQAVDAAFRDHNIEIPFPQRVLYSGDASKDDSTDGAATAN